MSSFSKMEIIVTLGVIILILIFIAIRFLRDILKLEKKKLSKRVFLSAKDKARVERKYNKLLAEFKRKHKRKPTKDDLFRVVIAASHHTFPVKGRNVKWWTKGKRGHWNRQKVRKYLLEKHKIVEDFRMR